MAKNNKVSKVMDEWGAGELTDSHGKVVKNRKQAIAIALSEQESHDKKMRERRNDRKMKEKSRNS